jgi:hypothetical protein
METKELTIFSRAKAAESAGAASLMKLTGSPPARIPPPTQQDEA